MNWLIDPVKNHYADFNGRATRQQYWMFVLSLFVLQIGLGILSSVIDTIGLLAMFVPLALLVPSIAITARRLHDIGKSGWWQLIGLIPLIGLIVMIIFTASKGDKGTNTYGTDPLGGGDSGGGNTTPNNPVPRPTDPVINNDTSATQ